MPRHKEGGILPKMPSLTKGRYRARLAKGAAAITSARALRTRAFAIDGPDCDAFDEICDHLLVDDLNSGQLVCCARLLRLADGRELGRSYAARYYDLTALARFQGPMAEMGRFCIHPNWPDPDILRLAWGAMTAYVDENRVEMLFGCSSFEGTDTARYLDGFAMLGARHLAPGRWLPGIKAAEVFRFCDMTPRNAGARHATRQMPPLLRSYLAMGGRVSDHAVIDREMNTLHVFTGLEIGAIPEGRKRLLRAVAGEI